MMLFLGVVLLFCDAPFIEDEQPYIMLRSGRRIWFIGQMLYIVVASVLYLIVLYFISVLVLLPHIEWSAEWGKLLSTFSQTSAAGAKNGISIPFARVITARFDPIPAVFAVCGERELGRHCARYADVLREPEYFPHGGRHLRYGARAVEHGDV